MRRQPDGRWRGAFLRQLQNRSYLAGFSTASRGRARQIPTPKETGPYTIVNRARTRADFEQFSDEREKREIREDAVRCKPLSVSSENLMDRLAMRLTPRGG